MKRRMIVAVLMSIAVLLGVSVGAYASNPADPTSDFRYSGDFLKVAWDSVGTASECVWFLGIKEIGNRTSVMALNEIDDCGTRLWEVGATKQFTAGEGTLEVGAFTDMWHGGENDLGGMLDWSNDQFGLGGVFRVNGCSKVAGRAKVAPNVTLNVAVPLDSDKDSTRYGVGYSAGKVRLEAAANDTTLWLRASLPVGDGLYPELRTKLTSDEWFVGGALGLALPK